MVSSNDQDPKSTASGITRRQFLPLLGVAAAAVAAPGIVSATGRDSHHQTHARARYVYVGTYTAPGTAPGGHVPSTSVGIYVFKMNPGNGDLTPVQVIPSSNPAFLAIDSSKKFLYACNEDDPGTVSSFAINQTNGTLSAINVASTSGRHPTHVSIHPAGYLMAANYSSGNVPVFRLNSDGSIGPMTDLFQGTGNGTGPRPDRQEAPHAHQVLTDVGANHVFDVDLGADKVNVLNLNPGTGTLTPNTVPFAPVASGSGPRHMVFHQNGKYAYVLNELSASIDFFHYDAARGALVWAQTISTLPKSWTGGKSGAEIRIHPNGRYLYSTNRGHNSVAIFKIDEDDGTLRIKGWESTRGDWPRGMNFDPSGTFLYVGNQNSDSIAVFRVRGDGDLDRSALVKTPVPVDFVFGNPV
jgi:6-phosphogluconolactonase